MKNSLQCHLKAVALFTTFFCFLFGTIKSNAQWAELGGTNTSTFNNLLLCVATDASGNVYGAGFSTNANGKYYVAKWNGSNWSELGGTNTSNFNGGIYAIAIYGSNVYIAGRFKNTNGKYYVAKWNGSSWIELGGNNTSTFNNFFSSVTTDKNGNVYAAGSFKNTNGYYYVAKWNGSSWAELGGTNTSTFNSSINSVATDGSGNVYVGGSFTDGTTAASGNIYMAKWNGSSWSNLGVVYSDVGAVNSIVTDASGNVYTAGGFTNTNGFPFVGVYKNGILTELGGANTSTLNGYGIKTITIDGSGNVYAGGTFTNTNGNYYVEKWNGSSWEELGGTNTSTFNNTIYGITTDGSDHIYAVGTFTNTNGNMYIAKYTAPPTFTYTITSPNAAFRDLGACLTGVNTSAISTQVYTYNGSSWTAYSGAMTPGTGYRAQIKGATTPSITVTGTATVTTDVTPSLTQGANAFSFVANPYNGVIDFTAITKSNLQGGFYYFDPTYVDNLGYQGFKYYGTLTGAANTFSNGLSLTQYIQPGQGFFVQNASSATPSLTFKTSAIVSGNQHSVFGVTAPLNRIATGLFVNGKNVDGAVVVFNNSFSNGLDNNDAVKMSNHGENITFTIANKDYCTNAFGLPTAADVLPMHLYNLSANTTYTFKLDASQFVGNGLSAYLQDNVINTKTLLTGNNNEVAFTTGTDATTDANRYSIVFGAGTLPVKSIALTAASLANKQVAIKWTTVGENNVANYQVERSENGTTFTELVTISPTTSHNYSYIDATATGANYYRIKATDNTGAVAYSNVAKLTTYDSPLTTLTVSPNPIVTNTFNVSLGTAGQYTVSLLDVLGKTVYTTTLKHTEGTLENISLKSKLAAGCYTLKATSETGTIETTQVIIK